MLAGSSASGMAIGHRVLAKPAAPEAQATASRRVATARLSAFPKGSVSTEQDAVRKSPPFGPWRRDSPAGELYASWTGKSGSWLLWHTLGSFGAPGRHSERRRRTASGRRPRRRRARSAGCDHRGRRRMDVAKPCPCHGRAEPDS